MHIAIVRPHDDESIVDVHIVDHSTKGPKTFEKEWAQTLERVKQKNPDEWDVTEVIEQMEKKGWWFLSVQQPIIVSY